MRGLHRLGPWVAVLAMGPVTGGLGALATHYAGRRAWGRVALCLAAWGAFWVIGPAVLAWELSLCGFRR